jgi:2-polyprenyl-3-methyl-5-hydroxy-6-metoxy-1,4-benzoquinol methylase
MMARARSWCVDHLQRLLGFVYYEYLFDTGTLLSHRLASRVITWEQARGKGDTPISKSLWEEQYGSGHWEYLHTLGELGRFSVLVGYLHELTPEGVVLDVGCGEGLLNRRLKPHPSRYLGLDISAAAIEKARATATGPFVCADAEQFVAPDTYDVIVFNECLYYFNDPVGTVGRYASALRPGGILIVSTFLQSRRGRAILRALKRAHTLIDETSIAHGAQSWTCSVFAASAHAVN